MQCPNCPRDTESLEICNVPIVCGTLDHRNVPETPHCLGNKAYLSCFCRACTDAIEPGLPSIMRPSFQVSLYTYTHAPMKLLYEFARALHMLLPKQIKVDAISTGLQ